MSAVTCWMVCRRKQPLCFVAKAVIILIHQLFLCVLLMKGMCAHTHTRNMCLATYVTLCCEAVVSCLHS